MDQKRTRLSLTRKTGETLDLGPNISVTVTEVRGDRVRLLIEAPAEVSIMRREMAERDTQLESEARP